MSDTLTITRPDDWHLHVRTGDLLKTVIPHTARQFGRALIMPNLKPPVTTVIAAEKYRNDILACLPEDAEFDPVMTLYLTDNTTIETVLDAAQSPHVVGFKLYPAGATTNSDAGVTRVSGIMPILEKIATSGLVLQVHGEVADSHIDIFDREAEFIDQILAPLHRQLPQLRIVFEHITTRQSVEFVTECPSNVAATITPQHLMYSRNDIFDGGIRPHLYCLPILKRRDHLLALTNAAISDDPGFFLGTDSAPHLRHTKETGCGCAGIYSAHAAMELYTEIFESLDSLDKLEGFASHFGADFYRVARNRGTITMQRQHWQIPDYYAVLQHQLIPLRAGETLRWKLLA